MNSMKVKNAAKINLALDVTGRLPNGYHTIESVFQTVGIYDETTVTLTGSGIKVLCDTPEKFRRSDKIPDGEGNIAYKAAKLFLEQNDTGCGCTVHIKKGIPSQAGMGGGSSDAAAVLYTLNKLTGAKMSNESLAALGKKLGADVPFFLTGGTAYVSGIGEKIVPISDFSGKILVIAKGAHGISTAEAYKKIDCLVDPSHPQTDMLIQAINSADSLAYQYFGNLFEEAVQLASVSKIKKIMSDSGALCSVMTGSGSAVFGLFKDFLTATHCTDKLIGEEHFAQVCRTVGDSFIVL